MFRKNTQGIVTTDENSRSNILTIGGFRDELSRLINSDTLAVRMDITPEMAEVMLERNASEEWKNRPQSSQAVARIAKTMKDARWMFTGEPIIFSDTGNLLNGQHRLTAAYEAQATFPSLVVFGIDNEAFKFMDIGTRRQASHIFSIEGVPNYTFAASVCRVAYPYFEWKNWSGHTAASNVKS